MLLIGKISRSKSLSYYRYPLRGTYYDDDPYAPAAIEDWEIPL